ncbi:4-hydroxy-tetrahydrodipicolinate reductase [bacterium BMS3Abin03]|nr:4-hydroxy-tetrahydrodipicolinate reductase [bacterium BMS3Abin03]
MEYGVIGASGRLGTEVVNLFNEKKHNLVFTYDVDGEWKNQEPDLLIDCSLPEVFDTSISYAREFNVPFIIATTGLTEDNFSLLKKYSKQFPIVQSYNFSLGIQVLLKLTETAKNILTGYDVEI